jgi:hypothetical protein
MLTLDEIKEAHGPSFAEFDVPEWSKKHDDAGNLIVEKVKARRLHAVEYLQFTGNTPGESDAREVTVDQMVTVIQLSLINEDGSQLIDDDHLYLLRDNPLLTGRLGNELMAFNRLTEGARKN